MDQEKRNKIEAKLNCPSTPEPEKQVCRDLLEKHKPDPPINPFDPFTGQKSDGAKWYEDAIKKGTDNRKIHFNIKFDGLPVLYSHYCEQCENFFTDYKQKSLYCAICLAALRNAAE
jgi:hypothetical protein